MISRHRGEADRSSFLSFLKMDANFSFLQSSGTSPNYHGFYLTAMTFQTPWRLAWQLHQPISSEIWNAPHLVSQTYIYSSSLGGHEPDLYVQWEGLFFPSPCLAAHLPKRCGKRACHWRLSTSALFVVTSLPALPMREGGRLSLTFLFCLTHLLVVLCVPCQVQLQLYLSLLNFIPTQTGSIPTLFQGYLFLFHCLCISFFHLNLTAGLNSAMLVSCLSFLISFI